MESEPRKYLLQPGTMLYYRSYYSDYCLFKAIVRKINYPNVEICRYKSEDVNFNPQNLHDIEGSFMIETININDIGINYFLELNDNRNYYFTKVKFFELNSEEFYMVETNLGLIDGNMFAQSNMLFFISEIETNDFLKSTYKKFDYGKKYQLLLECKETTVDELYDKKSNSQLESDSQNNVNCDFVNSNEVTDIFNEIVSDEITNRRFINSCSFKKLFPNNNRFKFDDLDVIYYFITYFPKHICMEWNKDYAWKNYHTIIDFKNEVTVPSKRSFPAKYFYKCLEPKISNLPGKWLICSIPSHDQYNSIDNPCNHMLRDNLNCENVKYIPDLLIRTQNLVLAKHDEGYGERSYEKDLESLDINPKYKNQLKDQNVIVIDDITTSGSSFIAARKLLLDEEINHIVSIAFSKTYEREYY